MLQQGNMSTEGFHSRKGKEGLEAAHLAQSRKIEAMGGLADEIAHDLNNLLSGILGLAEIVITRCLPPDSPAQGYLGDILEAGGRAKELVVRLQGISALASQEKDHRKGSRQE